MASTIPGSEGRAGMAAIVIDERFDLAAFRRHLVESLPHYARPMFLRLRDQIAATATFKHMTHALTQDGYDPDRIADALFVDDVERQAFVRLDPSLYGRIQRGHLPGSSHASA